MSHDEGDTSKESAQDAGPLVRGISFGGAMLLLALVLLIPTQYLNHTGFCYAEMKYLNEREIIDRFLFKENAKSLTLEEKKRVVKEKQNGAEYPACCKLMGELDERDLGWLETDNENYFLEKTLFGLFLYEMVIYRPHSKNTMTSPPYHFKTVEEALAEFPYQESHLAVNACGHMYWGLLGGNLSQKGYDIRLDKNREYWRLWEQSNANE